MKSDYCYPILDLHVHTNFSDGRNSVDEVARYAELCGLEAVAITDHLHMMNTRDLNHYINRIKEVSKRTGGTTVLTGLEVHPSNGEIRLPRNLTSAGVEVILFDPVDSNREMLLNLGLEDLLEYFAEIYREASRIDEIKIMAHPLCLGRFKFFKYYSDLPEWLIEEFLESTIQRDKYIEVMNGIAWWFPESPINRFTREYVEFLRKALRKGGRFSLGSDAHCAQGVGNLSWSIKVLRMAGAKRDDLISLKDFTPKSF